MSLINGMFQGSHFKVKFGHLSPADMSWVMCFALEIIYYIWMCDRSWLRLRKNISNLINSQKSLNQLCITQPEIDHTLSQGVIKHATISRSNLMYSYLYFIFGTLIASDYFAWSQTKTLSCKTSKWRLLVWALYPLFSL